MQLAEDEKKALKYLVARELAEIEGEEEVTMPIEMFAADENYKKLLKKLKDKL